MYYNIIYYNINLNKFNGSGYSQRKKNLEARKNILRKKNNEQSKKELEILARDSGVELDRRMSKRKLLEVVRGILR